MQRTTYRISAFSPQEWSRKLSTTKSETCLTPFADKFMGQLRSTLQKHPRELNIQGPLEETKFTGAEQITALRTEQHHGALKIHASPSPPSPPHPSPEQKNHGAQITAPEPKHPRSLRHPRLPEQTHPRPLYGDISSDSFIFVPRCLSPHLLCPLTPLPQVLLFPSSRSLVDFCTFCSLLLIPSSLFSFLFLPLFSFPTLHPSTAPRSLLCGPRSLYFVSLLFLAHVSLPPCVIVIVLCFAFPFHVCHECEKPQPDSNCSVLKFNPKSKLFLAQKIVTVLWRPGQHRGGSQERTSGRANNRGCRQRKGRGVVHGSRRRGGRQSHTD